MRPTLEEQETVINFSRLDETASVYTSDGTVMTKLDRMVKNNPDDFKLERVEKCQGDIVAKVYRCPVGFISFRSKKVIRELTDEQRAEMAERAKRIPRNKSSATIQESSAEA